MSSRARWLAAKSTDGQLPAICSWMAVPRSSSATSEIAHGYPVYRNWRPVADDDESRAKSTSEAERSIRTGDKRWCWSEKQTHEVEASSYITTTSMVSALCIKPEGSKTYVLSSPFAKPPHTSPAHTLRNTCQQAFPISIPPAQCPHLLNSLPYIVSCSQGDPSSVGHRFATWRMTTEKSSQALIRQKSPGRRRYLGVSGDIRNLETGHQP